MNKQDMKELQEQYKEKFEKEFGPEFTPYLIVVLDNEIHAVWQNIKMRITLWATVDYDTKEILLSRYYYDKHWYIPKEKIVITKNRHENLMMANFSFPTLRKDSFNLEYDEFGW